MFFLQGVKGKLNVKYFICLLTLYLKYVGKSDELEQVEKAIVIPFNLWAQKIVWWIASHHSFHNNSWRLFWINVPVFLLDIGHLIEMRAFFPESCEWNFAKVGQTSFLNLTYIFLLQVTLN